MSADEAPAVVDARGLRCPLPVVRLAAAARDAAPGTLLQVWSTDPAAALDVPAWARMRGHRLVDVDARTGDDDAADEWRVTVRVGP
ncbi:sulfurtransferase TusA family protein [Luteimicrobium subarcticum]|uniref:tRNA 2-thiouridine synthesizing protein A n=1 Tax=Luteimicrobium subarcticum TaxID=620910 RepID=A0A2M8WRD1_9MICO|nr:sulfurtransferase TusA family protein [Luteimicrobium subarcticum]PJI93478.1 tRNA 2-thiouridine synthesizing protein A [Luteimicrobium subarcticum]